MTATLLPPYDGGKCESSKDTDLSLKSLLPKRSGVGSNWACAAEGGGWCDHGVACELCE